jgi:hypothetical protein
MRILFFEDHAQAAKVGRLLSEEYNHDVYQTDSYQDFMEWMDYEPGADNFEALFVDLNVPRISMPEDLRNINRDTLSGMVFINEWLLKRYLFLKQRIILFSAYLDLLGDEINEYHVLDKSDPKIIEKTLAILEKLKIKKN